jgi:hypothetical protein
MLRVYNTDKKPCLALVERSLCGEVPESDGLVSGSGRQALIRGPITAVYFSTKPKTSSKIQPEYTSNETK